MKCVRCNEEKKDLIGIADVLMCKDCIKLTVKEAVIKADESVNFTLQGVA